jgi:DNA adenine methylase
MERKKGNEPLLCCLAFLPWGLEAGKVLTALIYPGGKVKISSWVISFFPRHKIYVEPFGGAAGVLLNKAPSALEVYNDLNSNLVNFFSVLRDKEKSAELIRRLRLTPYAREEYYGFYPMPDGDDIERARAFVVRASMGIGIRMAVSKSAPGFAGDNYKVRGNARTFVSHVEKMEEIAERFRPVVIEHKDALELIPRYDSPDTLWYLDPPYNCHYSFKYSAEVDQEAILDAFQQVRGYVVLSGYENALYADELAGWHMETRPHNTFRNKRTKECLWLSPRTWDALQRERRTLPLGEAAFGDGS